MHRRRFLEGAVAAVAATAASLKPIAGSARPTAPIGHAISIANFAFSPTTLSVRSGDRVMWTNRDIVPHTATADDGSWDSGEIGPGEQHEMVVTKGLTERYICRFHPSMTATLEVV